MLEVILLIMAIILFLGVIGDKEKSNKRLFCTGFIVCVVAIVVLEVMKQYI